MLKELKPASLQDEKIDTLLESFDISLQSIFSNIINALIYPRIDSFSGEVLDLLAWQFHIESWQQAETEEEKRALIKKAIELHRYKGTKWAVLNALKAAGYESHLQEWFEYVGEPYLFKVYTQRIIQNKDIYIKLRNIIYDYKNERSWLDSIGTHHAYEGRIYAGAVVWQGNRCVIAPNIPDFYVEPARYYGGFYFRMGNYISIGVANG